jgi:hypothetical protein
MLPPLTVLKVSRGDIIHRKGGTHLIHTKLTLSIILSNTHKINKVPLLKV